MSRLRIYGLARTRAFRAMWVATELGVDYELVRTEIGPAGAKQPAYLVINPNGRLPAIDDDGFVLWESLAITLYLAKKHGLGRLYPAAPADEARAWQWTLWAANEVERAVNIWSLHALRLPPGERDAEKLADALRVLAAPFRVLDGALADRPFLLGDAFTIADLNVVAVISRALEMDLSATPHLSAWLRRCLERPAALVVRKLRTEADAGSSADTIRLIARTNRL